MTIMSLRMEINAIIATEMVAQSKTLNFIVISTLSVKDYHFMAKKLFNTPLNNRLSYIYSNFSLKNPLYATSKLWETTVTPDAGTFDHTT